MRRIDGLFEGIERVLVHSELVDAAGKRAFIQETDDDFFPVDCWQERNTKVDFLAGNTNPETTILRQPALGNIETSEDFDARSDRKLERFRRRACFDQIAIHSVAQLKHLFEWLDMNVRRFFFQCLNENQ